MEYSVYVLQSLKNNWLYIGMTRKDPRTRLEEHNTGKNKYTRLHSPYSLVYFEMHYCSKCARQREKFLKSGIGRKLIKTFLGSTSI
jgi:putative endonuclease